MDMTQKNLNPQAQEVQAAPMVPPVDIREDAEGITVKADLPGVSRENLDIGIEGGTLTIAGGVSLGESARLKALHAEVRVARYQRSFVLSRDLDTDKMSASLKDGVLHIHIPKLETARPRRIAFKAA